MTIYVDGVVCCPDGSSTLRLSCPSCWECELAKAHSQVPLCSSTEGKHFSHRYMYFLAIVVCPLTDAAIKALITSFMERQFCMSIPAVTSSMAPLGFCGSDIIDLNELLLKGHIDAKHKGVQYLPLCEVVSESISQATHARMRVSWGKRRKMALWPCRSHREHSP